MKEYNNTLQEVMKNGGICYTQAKYLEPGIFIRYGKAFQHFEIERVIRKSPKTVKVHFMLGMEKTYRASTIVEIDASKKRTLKPQDAQETQETQETQESTLPASPELVNPEMPEVPETQNAPLSFYSLERILKAEADYNIVFGERSNGKTYAALEYALKRFIASGFNTQFAYIRRWKDDIRGSRAQTLFNGLADTGLISDLTHGEYTNVVFTNGRWFLAYYDDELDKWVTYMKPVGFAFALNEMEHDKSTSYPEVTTVIFDEFITRNVYLKDEFIIFLNVLSTIIRHRNNVKIFMLGNTVNKFCPYFAEMGLKHIQRMEQGKIDIYSFGSKLKIAVEYAEPSKVQKESNKYFAFDDKDSIQMIINGAWELAIYPHLTYSYTPQDIMLIYFIEFEDRLLQCEIVHKEDKDLGELLFTYVHEKTTPIKNPDTDFVYSLKQSGKPNYFKRLLSGGSKIERRIAWFYGAEKVFFQNNEIGEIVRNFILQSERSQFGSGRKI